LLGFAAGAGGFALINLGAWVVALAAHQTIQTGNAPEALYTSPNAVAMFLEPPVALAAGFALYAGERRDRLVAIAALAVMLPALYPHNVFLAMWAEVTIFGLFAFVLLLSALLWRGWRAYATTSDGFARPLVWGTAAAFVAITVHGFFDTPYFKNDLAVEFWTLAALEVAALWAFAVGAT